MKKSELICDFCDKQFVRETNYLKHRCKMMKRYEIFETAVGHLAYLTYNQWRKISNLPPSPADVFIKSKYFESFKKFAKFCRSQSIPDKIGYIELMVEKKLFPFQWCDSDVYDFYLETFDKKYTIDQKIDISLQTFKEISAALDIEIKDIFENLTATDILKLITSRRLTPWLLLPSSKFMEFMTYRTTKEERFLFNVFIDVKKWKKYFAEHPDKVAYIKKILKELNL